MKKIFITGVTGFIGCRLAELACERNLDVVGLVRQWSRAVRPGRLPIRMVLGDVLDPKSLREGMEDCDVVFHCAVDNRVGGERHRETSARGTDNVMKVALEVGVKRVVHLSSTAVFGYCPTPDAATEEGSYHYIGDAYCDGKIDSETIALTYYDKHALPVTVLRPTIVYGPFGDYSMTTVALLRQGRMMLVDGGKGYCNCLYVDNLVEAMLLAAEREDAVGKVFHISDAHPVTWKEFLEAHAAAIGEGSLPLPQIAKKEIEAAWGQIKKDRPSSFKQIVKLLRDPRTLRALRSIPIVRQIEAIGRQIGRRLIPSQTRCLLRQKWSVARSPHGPTVPLGAGAHPLLSSDEVNMITAFENLTFSIDKARQILGYRPTIDFSEGMHRTQAWIKWARL